MLIGIDSRAELLRLMGKPQNGATYRSLNQHCSRIEVDLSTLSGRSRHGSRTLTPEMVFGVNTGRSASYVKKWALEHGYLKHVCDECGCKDSWNGKPLTLQMDHINGNPRDNRVKNLRMLCPNCHSQTVTFAGRGRKSRKGSCLDCGALTKYASNRCKPCEEKRRRKITLPLEEVVGMVGELGRAETARQLGVSPPAISKFIKRRTS